MNSILLQPSLNDSRMRELREHERFEFRLAPLASDTMPAWLSSKPKENRGGLVMNLSQSGLQVMTSREHPLTADHYEVRLLLDDGADWADSAYSGPVRRVWTRDLDEPSQLSGFEFEHPDSPAGDFLQQHSLRGEGHAEVRCVLVERKSIGAFSG